MRNRPPVVLLVEDNPDDEALALLALGAVKVPHDVVVCRDGRAALAYMAAVNAGRDRDSVPALVLLDLKLPGIDGFDVLKAIRADGPGRLCPVVIVSTSDEPEEVHRAYVLGANAYIRKPVDFGVFAKGASVLMTFWLELNRSDHGDVSHPDRREGPPERRMHPERR
jgi:two-component system response regulator